MEVVHASEMTHETLMVSMRFTCVQHMQQCTHSMIRLCKSNPLDNLYVNVWGI